MYCIHQDLHIYAKFGWQEIQADITSRQLEIGIWDSENRKETDLRGIGKWVVVGTMKTDDHPGPKSFCKFGAYNLTL